jgi:hypothetical protein
MPSFTTFETANMKQIPLLLLMFFCTLTYAGQAYKSVDENGNITYSQFPPSDKQDSESITVKTQKSSSAAQSKQKLESARQKLLESSVDRNTETAEKKEAKEEAERMAENCGKAKQRLRDIQNNGRIYKTLEDGERHWYSEKEREGMISKAKEQVKKYCQ